MMKTSLGREVYLYVSKLVACLLACVRPLGGRSYGNHRRRCIRSKRRPVIGAKITAANIIRVCLARPVPRTTAATSFRCCRGSSLIVDAPGFERYEQRGIEVGPMSRRPFPSA